MGKVITSPVKRWPGTVTLSDPLTYPQAIAFGDALEAARELGSDAPLMRYHAAMLPGVTACVEAWNLEGIEPASLPATPLKPAAQLASWLIGEVVKLFQEAEDVPFG